MKTRIFAAMFGIAMFLKGENAAAHSHTMPARPADLSRETAEISDTKIAKSLSERQRILSRLGGSSMEKMIDLPVMARSEKVAAHWFVSRIDDAPVEIIAGMIPVTNSQEPVFIDFKIASDGAHRIIGIAIFVAFDKNREFTVPVIIQTFSENEAYDDEQYAQQRKLLGILHPRIGEVIAWTAENAGKILREALAKMEIASEKELARLIPPHKIGEGAKT